MLIRLNPEIWDSPEQFMEKWEEVIKLPDPRLRYFPLPIEEAQWHSLYTYAKLRQTKYGEEKNPILEMKPRKKTCKDQISLL